MAATTIKKQGIDDTILNHSMARQALINGNFDVWQRAVTATNPANSVFVADRWATRIVAGGYTPPSNVIHSRQALTAGDIYGSYYFYRINPDGAGSGLGATSNHWIHQNIENGTRFLCGAGKKVTVSFYARSSISNKKLGIGLLQTYGDSGSASEWLTTTGQTISLTSSWVKYSVTFTTNTLVGKTLNANDYLRLVISTVWGSDVATASGYTGTETYVGSGNIDIAQVQLCAGDVALPFQPKSFNDELIACMRYYEKVGAEASGNYPRFTVGLGTSTTTAQGVYYFKVPKRTNGYTLETTGTASHYGVYNGTTVTACSAIPAIPAATENTIYTAVVNYTVAAGLTAGNAYEGLGNNNASAYLAFANEL